MPLYEYKCEKCQAVFEKLRQMKEMDQTIECPQCGSEKTKRQLSVFGIGSTTGSAECKRTGNEKPPSCGGG
jgi:putative FmdB family regulatory protein